MPRPDHVQFPAGSTDDAFRDGAFVVKGNQQPVQQNQSVQVHEGSYRDVGIQPDMGAPRQQPYYPPVQDRGVQPPTQYYPPQPPVQQIPSGNDPITLTYKYTGHCPHCRVEVETLDLPDVISDKLIVVAICPTHGKQAQREVSYLQVKEEVEDAVRYEPEHKGSKSSNGQDTKTSEGGTEDSFGEKERK